VTARVPDDRADAAVDVLRRSNGIDIDDLRRAYEQQGWVEFDQDVAEQTEEQVREYRDRYPLVPPPL
jgi:hypothetical protein